MTYPILTVTLPLCSVLQQHDTIMSSSSEPHKMLSLRKIGNKFRRLIIPWNSWKFSKKYLIKMLYFYLAGLTAILTVAIS